MYNKGASFKVLTEYQSLVSDPKQVNIMACSKTTCVWWWFWDGFFSISACTVGARLIYEIGEDRFECVCECCSRLALRYFRYLLSVELLSESVIALL